MTLPPELIDEILTYLQDDKRTLRNCSLIAKSWEYPSRKLLFTNAHLTPETYRIWRENVSAAGAELLRYVRTLNCHNFHSIQPSHGDFFGPLHRLERLAFRDFVHIESNITNLFSAFQTTLSSLFLSHVSLTCVAFINVVDYFPNLRDLHVARSSFVGDRRAVPPLSRPPRGKLRISFLSLDNISALSSGLSSSELRYDELEIVGTGDQTPSRTRSIISACGGTLTRLVLEPYGRWSVPTLEDCLELRELVFLVWWPASKELAFIASVTSINIRKIAFVPDDMGFRWSLMWSSLDATLYSLVDRLRASGYEHTLELELRLEPKFAKINPRDNPDAFFPCFREKGRVTILEKTSGRIIYRSDG